MTDPAQHTFPFALLNVVKGKEKPPGKKKEKN